MPYVPISERTALDRIVRKMEEVGVCANGDLNYILFKFCKRNVSPSYNNYKNFAGELNECANEIRRRFLAPHEETKIIENGDVDEELSDEYEHQWRLKD